MWTGLPSRPPAWTITVSRRGWTSSLATARWWDATAPRSLSSLSTTTRATCRRFYRGRRACCADTASRPGSPNSPSTSGRGSQKALGAAAMSATSRARCRTTTCGRCSPRWRSRRRCTATRGTRRATGRSPRSTWSASQLLARPPFTYRMSVGLHWPHRRGAVQGNLLVWNESAPTPTSTGEIYKAHAAAP